MQAATNTVHDLQMMGIDFKVLAGQGANIDTTTANGRLIFGIFAALAEFERELIVERTQAGLKAARSKDRNGGRPRKMDAQTLKMAVSALQDRTTTVMEIAKRLNVTRTTLYQYVNGDGTLKNAGEVLLFSN